MRLSNEMKFLIYSTSVDSRSDVSETCKKAFVEDYRGFTNSFIENLVDMLNIVQDEQFSSIMEDQDKEMVSMTF